MAPMATARGVGRLITSGSYPGRTFEARRGTSLVALVRWVKHS
jgi:hypothetical protein